MFIDDFLKKRKLKPLVDRVNKLRQDVYLQKVLLENTSSEQQEACSCGEMHHNPMMGLGGGMRNGTDRGLYKVMESLDYELKVLSNLTDKKKQDKTKKILGILDTETIINERCIDSISAYRQLFVTLSQKYENGAGEVVGTPLQDSILETMINRNGTFTEKCANVDYKEIGESVRAEFNTYASNMQRIHDFDLEGTMKDYVALLKEIKEVIGTENSGMKIKFARTIPSLTGFIPMKNKKAKSKRLMSGYKISFDDPSEEVKENTSGLKKKIASQKDWKKLGELIASHHKETRSLKDAELLTLGLVPPGRIILVPKSRRKKISFEQLRGYEKEKGMLRQNTEKLLAGKEANNAFIYGPPGTGKSSMINALLTEYSRKGLRVIDIPKDAAPYLNNVFDDVDSRKDYKFIILADEFDVGKDDFFYNQMKTLMEGSFDGIPENAKLYIISNNEDCMRMGFKSEKADYRALEDRFGLVVKFHLPDEKEQKNIMQHYLGDKDLNDKVLEDFSKYCDTRHLKNPNPRNIRDYVRTLK
ncbi:DUF815 domain-containing protein [Nanoarchaeota archaeon]